MKKDGHALLITFVCSVCLVLGIFIGRNLNSEYIDLNQNMQTPIPSNAQDFDTYRLDINTATKQQLQELPGIGEVIAQRIIDYRTMKGAFESVDDLQYVEGIGDKKLDAILGFIKAGG